MQLSDWVKRFDTSRMNKVIRCVVIMRLDLIQCELFVLRNLTAAPVQPLPTSHLIFRVSSQGAGKCWMDALELALKCSSLLIRSMSTRNNNAAGGHGAAEPPTAGATANGAHGAALVPNLGTSELHWNESDFEKHFKDHGIFTLLANSHRSIESCLVRLCAIHFFTSGLLSSAYKYNSHFYFTLFGGKKNNNFFQVS